MPISLFAITFSAATAAVGYRAVPVAWGTVLVMAAAASSGVLAGGALGRRLNPAHLQAVFAACCSARPATSSSPGNRGLAMIVTRFFEPAIAQASYLIGCAATGEAIVIDPNRDIAPYLAAAAREGVRITHVTETHIHADFVSGARELAHATGAAPAAVG